MSTSINYVGRAVDLLIFQNTKPSGNQKVTMGFGAGELTTGIQKVAQTFATILLTDVGSVYDQPEYGTDLIVSIQSGRTQNGSDLESAFNLAASVAKTIMNAASEAVDAPPDERLNTVILEDYVLDKNNGKITLRVSITTDAGFSTVIYLPVSVPIR